MVEYLTTESVQGASLSLEGVDNVHGGHSLSLGVLSVNHSVSDDGAEEGAQDLPGVAVDVRGDSLDTASSGESSDGWLGDSLEDWSSPLSGVSLSGNLAVSFAYAFSAFASFSCHCN